MKERMHRVVLSACALVNLVVLGVGRAQAEPDSRLQRQDQVSPKDVVTTVAPVVREGMYAGTGSVSRSTDGEWTMTLNDSKSAVVFHPTVRFETVRLEIGDEFSGRLFAQARDRVLLLTVFATEGGIVYEAMLTVADHEVANVLDTLQQRSPSKGERKDSEHSLQTENAEAVEGLVSSEESVDSPIVVSGEEELCAGGSCSCGAGRCSACCTASQQANCTCGVFSDNCACNPAPDPQ